MITPETSIPAGPAHGHITVEQQGSERVLRLCGEIDAVTVDAFQDTWPDRPLVVDSIDASQVTFMAAAGVGLLLRVARATRLAGRVTRLPRTSRPVDRVLEVLELQSRFPRR